MPKDMPTDIHVKAVSGHPVTLPSGDFIANAVMTRVGQDLHLTADGHTVDVQGYFSQANPPELVTHDGAHLSPAMVEAFVPPEHVGQYASSGEIATDASPAGRITQVVGHDEIIRVDGTHVAAAVGTPIYQGDVIETSKTGAVNILFSDHTTFAVSENARMSVDKYIYHSAEHTGSTFFSMLQGMFVYTSGLIGKTEPGNVNIETPVGSIGIRGTVIAGHIFPSGHSSDITIVNGAITVTNGSGTIDMSHSFQTVAIDSYNAHPQPITMNAATFATDYSSLSGVASDTLHHFISTAPSGSTTGTTTDHTITPPPTSPTTGMIDTMPTSTTNTSTTTATTSFSTTTSTSSFGTSGTASFSTTSGGTNSTSTTTSAPPPTASATTSSTTTAAAVAPPPAFAVQLSVDSGYNSTDHITNDATLQAVNLAATATTVLYAIESGSTWSAIGASWSATPWSTLTNGTYIAEAQEYNANSQLIGTSAPITFTLDTVAPVAPTVALTNDTSGGSLDTSDGQLTLTGIEANAHIQYSTDGGTTWTATTAATLPTTWAQGSNTVEVRQIDQAGNISTPTSLTFTYDTIAPVAPTVTLSHDTGFEGTNIFSSTPLTVTNQEAGATLLYSTDSGVTWSTNAPTANGTYTVEVEQKDLAGNISTASSPLTYTINTAAVMNIATSSGQNLTESGLNNVLLGVGGDTITVIDANFLAADGGTGTNTLQLGNGTAASVFNLNTTTGVSSAEQTHIHNFANIVLGADIAGQGNALTLNNMTLDGMAYSTHTLTVSGSTTETGAYVNILADPTTTDSHSITDLHLTSGTWGVSQTLTYTGTYNDNTGTHNVTLNVNEFSTGTSSFSQVGSVMALDSAQAAGYQYVSNGNIIGTTGTDCLVEGGTGTGYILDGKTGAHDILIGNTSGYTVINIDNANFSYIDGGASSTMNTNTLQLDDFGSGHAASAFTLDFTSSTTGTVENISQIDLGTSSTIDPATGTTYEGNSVTLNVHDVFSMTQADGSGNHTLTIVENSTTETGAATNVVTTSATAADNFHYVSGTAGGVITYQGTYSNASGPHTVTLVIDDTNAATGAGHIAVHAVA